MNMTATKDRFFKPSKVSADAKASHTNSIVRDILDSEAAAREKKTKNLRALRLAQDAAAASDTSRSDK
jgi:hypothetical protein